MDSSLCRRHSGLLSANRHLMGQQRLPGDDRGKVNNSLLTINVFIFEKKRSFISPADLILAVFPLSDRRLYESSPVLPRVRCGQKGEETTV